MSGGDELQKTGIPAFSLDHNAPPDGTLALNIHSIAEATVDEVVQDAVKALTQAVAGATQWFTDAVRGELISQAVSASGDAGLETPTIPAFNLYHNAPHDEAHSSSIHTVAKTTVDEVIQGAVQALTKVEASTTRRLDDEVNGELIHHAKLPEDNLVELIPSPPQADESIQPINQASSASIRTIARATVDAVKDIVQAVERATDWITQAVENELVSDCLDPNERIAFHNATEWITQAVRSELIAHAVADAGLRDDSTISEQEVDSATEASSTPGCESVITDARDLAKMTAEDAVTRALENVTRAIGDANQCTKVVNGQLHSNDIECPSPDNESHINDGDNNFTECEEPLQPPPTTEETDESVHVPALQFPNSAAECSEADDDDEYDDYTPINSPTTQEEPSKTSIAVSRSPEQDIGSNPSVLLSERATPPDTKATPRRQSPNTTKRGLNTPRLKENAPSSAPPAIPSSPVYDGTAAESSVTLSSNSTLPPLVLPGVQPIARPKPHQHKTPRQTSSGSNADDGLNSSRSSTARANKPTPRTSVAAELELTPKSSARAAALIYAQKPSSPRRHHHRHHKPNKMRDSASQTSPPPSPLSTSLPLQPLLGTQGDIDGCEQFRANSKHSRRDQSTLENGIEHKSDGGNTVLLALLTKTSALSSSVDSSTKSSSPSRSHRSHGHGHSNNGREGTSPNKRSGYCQRCVFEGRSCKINDCLKHQVLK